MYLFCSHVDTAAISWSYEPAMSFSWSCVTICGVSDLTADTTVCIGCMDAVME